MVLLDSIIFGNLSYVIIGNVLRYYKSKDITDSEIKTLHGVTEIIHISDFRQHNSFPMYVNNVFPGIMLPLSGNSNRENVIKKLLRNNNKNIDIERGTSDMLHDDGYDVSYLNNNEEVKEFIYSKGIDPNSIPITYPLKVYYKLHNGTLHKRIYHNNLYYNTCRRSIKLATNFNRRLPLSLTNLFFSCATIGISWNTYLDLRNMGAYKPEYPLFHPNRYKEKLRGVRDYLLKL